MQAIKSWFSSHGPDPRTELQLEREKYILWAEWSGRYTGYMCIVPVFIAQMCLGSFYSTSIFNKWMDSHVWGSPGSNAGMFTCCVAFYGLGTIVFGNWVSRHGVYPAVRRSLLLTPIGWACASVASSKGQLWLLYLGYGLLHGMGCAHSYISTTAALSQWFPTYKGFMSGLAVCGAGVGSFVWTTVGRLLMDPKGPYAMTPPQVQAVFSVTFAVLLAIALPFLRNPPPGYAAEKGAEAAQEASADTDLKQRDDSWSGAFSSWFRSHMASKKGKLDMVPAGPWTGPAYSLSPDRTYTFLEACRTQEFVLTALLIFGQNMPGVVFLSSAADMVQNTYGFDPAFAALVTSWLNAVNFVGRFGWGFITDKIGRKAFWLLSTACQTIALALMGVAIEQRAFGPWLACFLIIGSLYGGGFGVLPAFLSDLFGPSISAATHGVMIGVWAVACIVGIPIFTSVTAQYSTVVYPPATNVTAAGHAPTGTRVPLPEAYIINSRWLAFLPALALVAALFLNTRREDRLARKTRGEAARVRLGPYVLACQANWLSPPQQAQQYEDLPSQSAMEEGGVSSPTDKASDIGSPMTSPNTSEVWRLVPHSGHHTASDPAAEWTTRSSTAGSDTTAADHAGILSNTPRADDADLRNIASPAWEAGGSVRQSQQGRPLPGTPRPVDEW